MNKESKMETLIKLLRTMTKEKFWGELTIRFKDGKPIVINKSEQIMLAAEDGK